MHFEGGFIGKNSKSAGWNGESGCFAVLAAGLAVLTYFGRVG